MLHFFRTPAALSIVMLQGLSVFHVDMTRFLDMRASESAQMVILSLLFLGFHAVMQLLTLWIAPRETVKALVLPAVLVGGFFIGLPVGMAVGTLLVPIIAFIAAFKGDPGLLFVGIVMVAYVIVTGFVFLAAELKADGRPVSDALWIIGFR